MKVIQPFFVGGICGLALAIAIAAGLFASPLRKGLYLDLDPEITGLLVKLDGLRDRLAADEMGIAESEGANSASAPDLRARDSLKAAQAGAWKEYRHWRNRLGELSRRHERALPGEFPAWAFSLRHALGPLAAVLALAPALFLAWRGARRAGTRPLRPGKPDRSQAEAMTSFESAVKEVARIAGRPDATPAQPAAPRTIQGNREATGDRKTEYLPEASRRGTPPAQPAEAPVREAAGPRPRREMPWEDSRVAPGNETPPEAPREAHGSPAREAPVQAFREAPREEVRAREEAPLAPEPSPYEVSPNAFFREPETKELPILAKELPTLAGDPAAGQPAAGPALRAEGLETQIIKLGPGGWGEARPASGKGSARPPESGLSMQDEEDGGADGSGTPPPGTFMPPTTEVERVERRKAEVLKLARKGLTSSEISKRLRISQDQVEIIIRLRREKG